MIRIIIVLAFFVGSQLVAQWKWQNPALSATTFREVKFVDGSAGVAVGDFGTIVRTTDGGLKWSIIFSGTESRLNSLSFADARNGWICGANGTVLRSTDAGATWIHGQPFGQGNLVAVKFLNPSDGWVAAETGELYQTTDGGAKWTKNSALPTSTISTILPISSAVWIVVSDVGRVYRTLDGGHSWETHVLSYVVGKEIAVASLRAVSFASFDYGWIVGDAMYRTTDGGATWRLIPGTAGEELTSLHFLDQNFGLVVGRGKVKRSTDGGISWQEQPLPLDDQNTNLCSITFKSRPIGIIVGENGTILYSSNNGASWTRIHTGDHAYFRDIHFSDSRHGWAVGGSSSGDNRGVVYSTTNGGDTWSEKVVPRNTWFMSVYFVDRMKGWICGGGGTILRTRDGGSTWESVSVDMTNFMGRVFFVDSLKGWIVGGGGILLRTSDGGTNWHTSIIAPVSFGSVFFLNKDTGFAVNYRAEIYRTRDGGLTWFVAGSDSAGHGLYSIYFSDRIHGWTVGYGATILSTTDGGESWHRQNTGVSSYRIFNDVHFADSLKGWAVGYDGLLLHTTDGGRHWQDQTLSSRLSLYSVFASKENEVWIGGEHVAILKKHNGETLTSIPLTEKVDVSDCFLGQNYPNPFNYETTVSFNLPRTANVSLKVYDITGQLVSNLVTSQLYAGSYAMKWPATDLPSGVYFYSLVVDGRLLSRKAILMK